jgi:hypothetical protein
MNSTEMSQLNMTTNATNMSTTIDSSQFVENAFCGNERAFAVFRDEELTLCFTDVALLLPACVFVALIAVPVMIYRIRKHGAPGGSFGVSVSAFRQCVRPLQVRVVTVLLGLIFATLRCITVFSGGSESGGADVIAQIAFTAAWLASLIVVALAHRASMHVTWILRSAWVALFVAAALRLQVASDTRKLPDAPVESAAAAGSFGLFVVLFILQSVLAVSCALLQ